MARLEDVILRDTRAAQPAATAVAAGTLYCVTDEAEIIERSNGTTWDSYGGGGGGGTSSSASSGSFFLAEQGGGSDDGGMVVPGPQGPAGNPGATGPAGPIGFPGADGADGEQWAIPGAQGPTGNTGATGATGPAGPAGLQGDPGDDGESWPIPGPVGATGATGSQGVAGGAGVMGLPGEDGEDGEVYVMGTPTSAIRTLGITIDGGGSAITTGVKGYLEVPFAYTILSVQMFADVSGSIVADIWNDTYANFPPTVADTITASAKPTISAAVKSQDTTLTGWTKSFAVGRILAWNVDNASTVTRVQVQLTVQVAA